MPKYDAFGRELGEDTLAGLGGNEPAARATPQPAPAAEETAPETPPEATFTVPGNAGLPGVRRRRGSGLGCLVGLVVLGAIVAGPVIAVMSFVDSASDAIDDVSGALDAPTIDPGVLEEPGERARPPVGIAGRSLIARANFAKALERLDGLGGVTFIRLAPERADVALEQRGKQRNAQVDFRGELDRGSATRAGSGADPVPIAAIDRAAPERLVRASVERYGLPVRKIDYVLLMPWPGEGYRWRAYFKQRGSVQGDADGRVVRRYPA